MELPATYVEGFHNLNEVQKLKYVSFGNTGLKVSFLGFGGGCFGNLYGGLVDITLWLDIVDHHRDFKLADAENAVREALKKGVNYIDTAPYYGEGKSEETLGKILKNIPRSAFYIATKVGRYSQDPKRAFNFGRDAVIKSVDDSLKRLGLEYIDLIQIHDVEFAPSVEVIVKETLPALEEVVKAGKAKFIGVTGYPLNKLWEVIERSNTKIDAVLAYCRLTLMDDALNDYLSKFKSKGLAVLHASPTAMGLLTNRGSWSWHPGNILYKEICSKAGNYCRDQGVELGKLAVHYTMSQQSVDVHLIGMPTIEFVNMNLDTAIKGVSEKEEKVLQEIFQRFFKPSDKRNWENIELSKYKESRLALGLD